MTDGTKPTTHEKIYIAPSVHAHCDAHSQKKRPFAAPEGRLASLRR